MSSQSASFFLAASFRSLLIATTLVAVVLGLVIVAVLGGRRWESKATWTISTNLPLESRGLAAEFD